MMSQTPQASGEAYVRSPFSRLTKGVTRGHIHSPRRSAARREIYT
jgi:hypothetical protein